MCKWKPDVEFQYGGRLGEFNGMSSQSHVSHCRVLPVGVLKTRIMRLECGEKFVDTCSHFEADRDCVYAQFIKLLSHY